MIGMPASLPSSTSSAIITSGVNGISVTSSVSGSTWISTTSTLVTEGELNKVIERIEAIEKRLLLIEPNEELHQKYPALKEAYDSYKLIEKIVNDQKTT